MAYTTLTDGMARGSFRTAINTNFRSASDIYPGEDSYNFDPIETSGNGAADLEFINIGNPGFVPQGTETRNLVPAGILRIGGNVLLTRNLTWDQANLRWATPYQETDAYGSGMLEMGGEGINMQVSPPADNFYNGNRMLFSFRQSDARGVPGYSTGPVNHGMAPLFMHYATTSYQSGKLRSWIPSTATSPLIHLHSDELKGTAGTFDQNEYLRLETNSSTTTAFPTLTFKTSSGSYETRTTIVTNRTVGSIGSIVYEGTTDQKTAEIQFTTRGTISSGNAAQSIKFLTSASNTAGITTRMEIMHDGVIKNFVPWRLDNTSITTIPDYSTLLTSPVMSTSTVGQIQSASGSTGGLRFFGFSTTSTASTAIPILFSGVLGATSPTAPAMAFAASKHNGSTSMADIASTEIVCHFRNNATVLAEMLGSGNIGFGVTGPGAKVQIRATTNNAVSLLVEDDGGNDILSVGESGGARVIGFFGVTPAIRQVVPTGVGTSIDTVITALQNLGLFAQS